MNWVCKWKIIVILQLRVDTLLGLDIWKTKRVTIHVMRSVWRKIRGDILGKI